MGIIRRLEWNDLYQVKELRNKYIQYLRQKKLLSQIDQEKWFENESDKDQVWYVYEDNENVDGVFGLTYIDMQSRKCELSFITKDYVNHISIILIQEAERIAFNELGINKLWVELYEFDRLKWDMLVRNNYTQEAILRQNYFWDGRFYDSVILSKLASEYHR